MSRIVAQIEMANRAFDLVIRVMLGILQACRNQVLKQILEIRKVQIAPAEIEINQRALTFFQEFLKVDNLLTKVDARNFEANQRQANVLMQTI